jgi:hypothetical protein
MLSSLEPVQLLAESKVSFPSTARFQESNESGWDPHKLAR